MISTQASIVPVATADLRQAQKNKASARTEASTPIQRRLKICYFMNKPEITEDMIFACFAAGAAGQPDAPDRQSFVDVEEYENQIMYPEFARWAEKATADSRACSACRQRGKAACSMAA